jgi:hypothetical protein
MQTVPTLPVIPTRYKSKIAHTHSYSIGAEAISKALAGVPQFEGLELTFWDYQFQPHATSYKVLDIAYRNLGGFHSASKDMIESGYLDEKWNIHVKPVPRSQRRAIQTDLLERGLPFVKKWLTENRNDEQRGRAGITLSWYEVEQRLGYEVAKKLEPKRI